MPRLCGVGGAELDERPALERAVVGQVRVAAVEEAGVVLRCQQLQRVARGQLVARGPRRAATKVGSAGWPIAASAR